MKITVYVIVALLLIAGASACQEVVKKCSDIGSGYYTIEKWEYEGGGYVLETDNPAYDTSASGDAQSVDWTSLPPAAAVIAKAGTSYKKFAGGPSGTIDVWHCWWQCERNGNVYNSDRCHKECTDISHIELCGYHPPCVGDECDPGDGVPEFSTITLGAAVAVSLLGMLYLRKR